MNDFDLTGLRLILDSMINQEFYLSDEKIRIIQDIIGDLDENRDNKTVAENSINKLQGIVNDLYIELNYDDTIFNFQVEVNKLRNWYDVNSKDEFLSDEYCDGDFVQ